MQNLATSLWNASSSSTPLPKKPLSLADVAHAVDHFSSVTELKLMFHFVVTPRKRPSFTLSDKDGVVKRAAITAGDMPHIPRR